MTFEKCRSCIRLSKITNKCRLGIKGKQCSSFAYISRDLYLKGGGSIECVKESNEIRNGGKENERTTINN